MDLAAWKEPITRTVELAGVLILVGAIATARFLVGWAKSSIDAAYREYRQHLGPPILLGLEFLVAGDIINTAAIAPSLQSVAIRTVLSFLLEVEIEGRWPWARARGAETVSRA
jgi:uncharacterized membrane protein